jgi:transposase
LIMEDQLPPSTCENCRRLEERIVSLEAVAAEQRVQIASLTAALEESRRSGKRQAAPFRKGPPASAPKRPGRKSGDDYGKHARRAAPTDEQLDEIIDVPLPSACPHCESGDVRESQVASQYQIELPQRPIQRRFDVHVGCCGQCGERLQGRHELQTSNALGAAAVQLGPRAQAAMAWLNKSLGLAHGKVVKLFKELFGITISRSTSVRSVLRTATRCEPQHREIQHSVRGSSRVTADETGWRVGGQNAWLHVVVGTRATLYEIDDCRGFEVTATMLGADFQGHLIHDGWKSYDKFQKATHQQCVAHILRRARELKDVARGVGVLFPQAIILLFQDALALRDAHLQGSATRAELSDCADLLEDALGALVTTPRSNAEHAKFAKHLRNHLGEWFTFLRHADVDATNFRAEQAIRPAVVNRKVWGGNRTWVGAHAQAVLSSVLVTCDQLLRSPLHFLSQVLTATKQPRLIIDSR